MSTWHTKDAHSGGYKNKRNKDGVRCKIKQHNGKPTCQKTLNCTMLQSNRFITIIIHFKPKGW